MHPKVITCSDTASATIFVTDLGKRLGPVF
jgi:hypothetical protein